MLVDEVQESVLLDEIVKKCECECCEIRQSRLIYLVKQGFCTVLSHVCDMCMGELEQDCLQRDLKYQFLTKYKF